MLAGYILRTPIEKRARIHNWALIESFKEGSSWELVDKVEKLQLPLFPEELNDLNIRLANFAAGGDSSAARELYRTTRDTVLFGGGYLPVYGSDGTQIGVTDNADNERAFHATMNEFAEAIASLERRFQDFSRATRTTSSSRGGDNGRIIRQKMEELQRLLDYGDYEGASRGRSATPRRTSATPYTASLAPQQAARRAPTSRRSGSANRMQPRHAGGGEVRIADGSAASSVGAKNWNGKALLRERLSFATTPNMRITQPRAQKTAIVFASVRVSGSWRVVVSKPERRPTWSWTSSTMRTFRMGRACRVMSCHSSHKTQADDLRVTLSAGSANERHSSSPFTCATTGSRVF